MSSERTPFDPWTNGTPGYRAALVVGMGATALGIVVVIIAAFAPDAAAATFRTIGLVLLGLGILSHLFGLLLRRRQAAQIIRARRKDS